MVTWNRLEYFEKTIDNLLRDQSDFRLYFWDNGSKDGVRERISDLTDPRIAGRFLSPENVGQFDPWHWFLEQCKTDTAGKLDDDIIGEHGWMTRFSTILTTSSRLGVLGAWVYLREEWDDALASHKIVSVGSVRLFQNGWVPGGICLARLPVLKKFSHKDRAQLGVPLNQLEMTRKGFVNGYPLPMSFADHLDDPRSPHCRMNTPGGWDQFAAYSARMRKFSGPEEYARWIAEDARRTLTATTKEQLRMLMPTRRTRLRRKIGSLLRVVNLKN
jgi:hypothetical protein